MNINITYIESEYQPVWYFMNSLGGRMLPHPVISVWDWIPAFQEMLTPEEELENWNNGDHHEDEEEYS